MDDADLAALSAMRDSEFAARSRSAPVLVIERFLADEIHDEVLESLIAAEPRFRSNLAPGRESLALFDAPEARPVLDAIERRFDEVVAAMADAGAIVDGVDLRGIEPPAVSASGHGSFHAPHTDNDPTAGFEPSITRRLSFVWHAFRTPQAFTGGELRVWDHADVPSERGPWTPVSTWTDHACGDNQLIVFSSYSRHEVVPVHMPDGTFADRRFAVVTAAHAH